MYTIAMSINLVHITYIYTSRVYSFKCILTNLTQAMHALTLHTIYYMYTHKSCAHIHTHCQSHTYMHHTNKCTQSKPIKSTVLIREQARPILSGLFVKLARDDGKGELRSLYTIHHKQNTCAPHSISKWAHHMTNTGKHPPQAEHMRPTFNQ